MQILPQMKNNRQQRQRRNAGFSAMHPRNPKLKTRGPQTFRNLFSVSREPVIQIHKMGSNNPNDFRALTATSRGKLVMRHACAFINTRHGSKAERNADLDSILN